MNADSGEPLFVVSVDVVKSKEIVVPVVEKSFDVVIPGPAKVKLACVFYNPYFAAGGAYIAGCAHEPGIVSIEVDWKYPGSIAVAKVR